jgi:hypothetical protein
MLKNNNNMINKKVVIKDDVINLGGKIGVIVSEGEDGCVYGNSEFMMRCDFDVI